MKTLIFKLREPLSQKNEKLLMNFGVRKKGEKTIEMVLEEDETREDAIKALARLDIEVI